MAEHLVERAFHEAVLMDPIEPLLMILAERARQALGQLVLDEPPPDAPARSHGGLELLIPGQPADGRAGEGLGGVHALAGRDGLAACAATASSRALLSRLRSREA